MTSHTNIGDAKGPGGLAVTAEVQPNSLVEAIFLGLVVDEGLRHHHRAGWRTPKRRLPGRWRREHHESGAAGEESIVRVGHALAFISVRLGFARIRIAAPRRSDVEPALRALRRALPADEPSAAQVVDIEFWWSHSSGVASVERTLEVPRWEEIEANYAGATRAAAKTLMRDFEPNGSGSSVLWTGPPGTGKTYALRALAWEWRRWCEFSVIADAESFLGQRVDYLMEVITSGRSSRWRVVVLEDAGELLCADARSLVGQGLSRFLNLCDGLLGQGERVILIVTTNEPLRRLHPAVSRSGRCASQIEFSPFGVDEANAWLADRTDLRVSAPTAVADLYAIASGREAGRGDSGGPPRIGFAAA
jgi:primosomal protein N'